MRQTSYFNQNEEAQEPKNPKSSVQIPKQAPLNEKEQNKSKKSERLAEQPAEVGI